MVIMSDDFKNSISSTEREMKGYVEVTYSSSKYKDNASITNYPASLKIGTDWVDINQIIDNDRKGKNYASLEEDYFQLDGTFVLPNNQADKNPGMGYVSADIFEEDMEIPITPFMISTSLGVYEKVNGLTLYFQNNKPLSLEIEIRSGDGSSVETFTEEDCTISENGIVTLTFSERTLLFVRIYVKDVLYPNRRLRLQEVDFGLSMIYENEELISFKTIEEIDIFNDSIPNNEIEVKIGDFTSSFDFKNKKGITSYLNNGVLIKPFVGVITSGNGVEYCPKGTYWLDSYDTNGKEATLKGKDIYSKLQDKDFDKYYVIEDDRKINDDATIKDYLKFKSEKWGVNIIDEHLPFDEIRPYGSLNEAYIDEIYSVIAPKVENLQKMAIVGGGTFNSDRYGNVIYKSVYYENDTNATGKFISFDNMKEYPKIVAKTPIKTFDVKETTIKNIYVPSEWQTFYENQFTSNDIITLYIDVGGWVDMQFPNIDNADVLTSSWSVDPTLPEGEQGYYGCITDTYAFVKLKCKGNVKISIEGYANERTETSNIRNVEDNGSDISISDDFIATNGTFDIRVISDAVIDFNLERRKKYSASFSYNGDPSLECGDAIYIENKYDKENYDGMIITKIESEFKGSYTENVEGDFIER